MNEFEKEDIKILTDGNPDTLKILLRIQKMKCSEIYMLFLKLYDIKGEKLNKLFVESCNSDYDTLEKTLFFISNNFFSISDINLNLELDKSIPFITEEVKDLKITDLHKLRLPSKFIELSNYIKTNFNVNLKKAIHEQNKAKVKVKKELQQ